MKTENRWATILSRLSQEWARFLYETDLGPPPWHREKMVDSIDLGYRLMADIRIIQDDDRNESFLIDLMDKQDDFHTVAVFRCCDIEAVIGTLIEADAAMQRYKNSVPVEEWADD